MTNKTMKIPYVFLFLVSIFLIHLSSATTITYGDSGSINSSGNATFDWGFMKLNWSYLQNVPSLSGFVNNLNWINTTQVNSQFLNLSGTNANQNLNISSFNITANYFIGNGSLLTGITGDNLSWNQSFADSRYSSIIWGYNQTLPAINLINNSWNESRANLLYSNIQWNYNQTTPFTNWLSTFVFNYNQTIPSNSYTDTQIINLDNNTIVRTGNYNCTSGQVFQNITVNSSGVFGQCVTASSSSSLFVVQNGYITNSTTSGINTTNLILSGNASMNNLTITQDVVINGVGVKQWLYNQSYSGSTFNSTYNNILNQANSSANLCIIGILSNGTAVYSPCLSNVNETNLVHINGTETITGSKTFTGVLGLNGLMSVSDNVQIQWLGAIEMGYSSGTSQFTLSALDPGQSISIASGGALGLSGSSIATSSPITTSGIGDYGIGTSTNYFGTIYATGLSNGGVTITPSTTVTTNTAQNIGGAKTLSTTTALRFRAPAQNISSSAANVLDIGAGATLNIRTPSINTIFNSTGQTINKDLNILGNFTIINIPTGSTGTDTDYLCVNITSGRVFRNETGC